MSWTRSTPDSSENWSASSALSMSTSPRTAMTLRSTPGLMNGRKPVAATSLATFWTCSSEAPIFMTMTMGERVVLGLSARQLEDRMGGIARARRPLLKELTVPAAQGSARVVGALHETEEGGVRVRRPPRRLIGEDELA